LLQNHNGGVMAFVSKKKGEMDGLQTIMDFGPAFLHYTLPKMAKMCCWENWLLQLARGIALFVI
jgi:hypothetical protein